MVPSATDSDFTPDQLTFAFDQFTGLSNAMKLEQLRALDRIECSDSWTHDGARSLEDWVAYRCGMSWTAASEHVRVMRALRVLPKIASAFGEGQIAWDVLVELCAFVEPSEDAEWADRAGRIDAAQVKRLAQAARRLKREDAARAQDNRSFSIRFDERSDIYRLNGILPPAEGVLFKKVIDDIAGPYGGPDASGDWIPYHQRAADALVELAGAKVTERRQTERTTVLVHVDARELNYIHGKAFLGDGEIIPSETARRLACDGNIQLVLESVDGQPIGIGRCSRIVPVPLARAVRKRDKVCRVCSRSWGLEIHHVIHWAHSGPTDLSNLILMCRSCHKLLHDRGFRIARTQYGDVRLVKPNGVPVRNRPERLRPVVRERMLGPPR